jgi:tetratricopeptide (TPR) repeat protein
LSLAEKIHAQDPEKVFFAHYTHSRVLNQGELKDDALNVILKGYGLIEKLQTPKALQLKFIGAEIIGTHYILREDNEQALNYYNIALDLKEKGVTHETQLAQLHQQIAFVYYAQKDGAKTVEHLQNAINIRSKYEDFYQLSGLNQRIAEAYYVLLNDKTKAEEHFDEAIRLRKAALGSKHHEVELLKRVAASLPGLKFEKLYQRIPEISRLSNSLEEPTEEVESEEAPAELAAEEQPAEQPAEEQPAEQPAEEAPVEEAPQETKKGKGKKNK